MIERESKVPKEVRTLVCGGRDYDDVDYVYQVLDRYVPHSLIISGHAKGADSIAEMYADERGIPLKIFPADWDKFGKSAGYHRNAQMLEEGKPDRVIAFPGGRGTALMVSLAQDRGVVVLDHRTKDF